MKVGLYQIYDVAAQQVTGPIMAHHNENAVRRDFVRLLSDTSTEPGKYPDEYNLICLGEQDTETGRIDSVESNIVMRGADWKELDIAKNAEHQANIH